MAEASNNNYVVGRGRLKFDMFTPGTKVGIGERYFGNTPELTNSTSSDTLDHFDSDQGLKVKDASVDISNDLSGSFTTDNISPPNVALFFSGSTEKQTVVTATAVVDPDVVVKRGFTYQLGVSTATPAGTRKVTNVLISTVVPAVVPTDPPVVTPIAPASYPGNVDIDLARGNVYIELTAPLITDGTKLRITYDQGAYTSEIVIGKSTPAYGALRFESTNPVGKKQDFFWPYVKITPNGDYSLKGDDWQVLGFNFEVLKRDSNTERVYITDVPT